MSDPPDRLQRRHLFDAVADVYDDARPPYPDALVSDLIAFTDLAGESRVLEIGPGTGQLTRPLADTGASVLAVELGAELAAVARQRLSDRDNVEVVVGDFDAWEGEETFDVVAAASCFHWLDPEIRVRRCRDALGPGGHLAVVDVLWGVDDEGTEGFFDAIQACYERCEPDDDPGHWHPTPEEVPTRREELEASGLFEEVRHRRYAIARRYSREAFLTLIATYSTVGSWAPEVRDGFLACVSDLFEARFPDGAVQTDLYDLTVGRLGGGEGSDA